jgi:hypothetical protein
MLRHLAFSMLCCTAHMLQVPDELVLHVLRRSGDEANDKEL